MKRKLFTGFAAVLLIIAISFAFSACTILFKPTHSHSYKETVVEPTCTEDGYTLYECECGDSYKDGTVPALGHTPVEVDEKTPTCSEEGYTAGIRCSVCGVSIKDSQDIEKLPHTPEIMPAKAATCTESGLTEGEKCSVCGTVIKEQQPTEKLPHTPEIIPAKAATCTESGLTEGEKCSVCGTVTKQQQETEATGHDYSVWTTQRSVTCVKDGLRVSICPDCGHREEEVIKAFGHRGEAGVHVEADECVICNTLNFLPREGNSSYGYCDFHYTVNGAAKQRLYYEIYLACEQLYESKADLEMQTAVVGADEEKFNYYAAAEIGFTGYGLSSDEAQAVWRTFYVENPAYFWMSNSVFIIEKISSDNERSMELVVMVDGEFATYERRQKAQTAIDEMTKELNIYLGVGLTPKQKALKIHDFICERITYAYEDDGVTPVSELWAHNMIGAAENRAGTCETYAKTYLYYCLKSGVNCIMVGGDANGAHAWNYIEIDGNWYGVDVTWDDAGKNYTHTYFGASESRMNGEHTPSEREQYYKLPQLSKTPLSV